MKKNLSYEQAAHAMQTGVAFDQAHGSEDGSPKHLRVGINAAMSDHAGLVDLLIAAGVITREQYLEAIRVAMVAEADRYERHLAAKYGVKVTLG